MGKGSDFSTSSSDSDPKSQKERDKNWAMQYVNGPLHEPEPSQRDGPGSSFHNPKRTLSVTGKRHGPPQIATGFPGRQDGSLPSPPPSASPARGSFHHTNPFADDDSVDQRRDRRSNHGSEWAPASSILDHRPGSNGSSYRSGPRSPEPGWRNTGGSIGRSNTTRNTHRSYGSQDFGNGSGGAGLHRSSSAAAGGVRRSGSLSQRHHGDMTHRPLDMLKHDHRAADRAPHLRNRRNHPNTDIIDGLDNSGAFGLTHHHGGPYDATLASRNTNKLHSPLEAVKDSNMEALRATPREYVQDSLQRRVPLQGVGTVPPGQLTSDGQRMRYREGADLMREPDAAGGPYRRYPDVVSNPTSLSQSQYQSQSQSRSRHSSRRSEGYPPSSYYSRPSSQRHMSSRSGDFPPSSSYSRPSSQRHMSSRSDGCYPSTSQPGEECSYEPVEPRPGQYPQNQRERSNEFGSSRYDDNRRMPQQLTTTQQYHPDDLKGKGEPSFSIDRAVKDYKALSSRRNEVSLSAGGVDGIEMAPQRSSTQRSTAPRSSGFTERFSTKASGKDSQTTTVRMRSVSDATSSVAGPSAQPRISPNAAAAPATATGHDAGNGGLTRRNTTGGRFEGLKKRFASLRRKKPSTEQ